MTSYRCGVNPGPGVTRGGVQALVISGYSMPKADTPNWRIRTDTIELEWNYTYTYNYTFILIPIIIPIIIPDPGVIIGIIPRWYNYSVIIPIIIPPNRIPKYNSTVEWLLILWSFRESSGISVVASGNIDVPFGFIILVLSFHLLGSLKV